jgi:hypothetical protein
MKKRGESAFGYAFIVVPLALGTFLNFIVVFLGLGFILRGLNFETYAVENLVMIGFAAFGALIILGFLMMSSSLFKQGILCVEDNKGFTLVSIGLKVIWMCSFLLAGYSVYISALKFVVSSPAFGLGRDYQLRPFPFTTFSGRVDLSVIPLEQFLVLLVIALIIVVSPILLSYIRDLE